uniref:Uncharacterized protein n=2 Tax=viral metagenome TaxID=1070528 RepID=A0A6M3MGY8_9ZZZZ
MKLTTMDYNGSTIPKVIKSLRADKGLVEFIRGANLRGGDVLEAIASIMVYSDPKTVSVDNNGNVTTSDDGQ